MHEICCRKDGSESLWNIMCSHAFLKQMCHEHIMHTTDCITSVCSQQMAAIMQASRQQEVQGMGYYSSATVIESLKYRIPSLLLTMF